MVDKEPVLEESPYYTFLFAIRSQVTREKYLGRLALFMTYAGITDGTIQERCNALGQKAKTDTIWLTSNVIRYLHNHRERAERGEISGSTLRNYFKPIKLFCEQLEIALP